MKRFYRLVLSLVLLLSMFALPLEAYAQHYSSNGAKKIVAKRAGAKSAAKKSKPAAQPVQSADLTPEQVFAASRQQLIQFVKLITAADDNPKGQKLLAVLKPRVLHYLEMPCRLVGVTNDGDKCILTYTATPPSTDLGTKVTFTKNGSEWKITNQEFLGGDALALMTEPTKIFCQVFPQEALLIQACLLVFVIAIACYYLSFIMQVVVAFRVSVVWGLVTLFVPFGNFIFTAFNWQVAKMPFFFSLSSIISATISACIPMIVVPQSLSGVERIFPDFSKVLDDQQTKELLRRIKQSTK